MNANRTVSVEFSAVTTPKPTYTLTVSIPNGHGTVSPSSGTYNQGTTVSLTAAPDSGYKLKSWKGTVNDSSTSTTNSVIMDADRTVTVEFEAVSTSPESSDDDDKGGGGGGCYITAASTDRFPLSGMLLLSIIPIAVLALISNRKLTSGL